MPDNLPDDWGRFVGDASHGFDDTQRERRDDDHGVEDEDDEYDIDLGEDVEDDLDQAEDTEDDDE